MTVSTDCSPFLAEYLPGPELTTTGEIKNICIFGKVWGKQILLPAYFLWRRRGIRSWIGLWLCGCWIHRAATRDFFFLILINWLPREISTSEYLWAFSAMSGMCPTWTRYWKKFSQSCTFPLYIQLTFPNNLNTSTKTLVKFFTSRAVGSAIEKQWYQCRLLTWFLTWAASSCWIC